MPFIQSNPDIENVISEEKAGSSTQTKQFPVGNRRAPTQPSTVGNREDRSGQISARWRNNTVSLLLRLRIKFEVPCLKVSVEQESGHNVAKSFVMIFC